VLEALMLDVWVPMTVDAQARDGFVTLTGTAQWHYQREAAEFRITDVPGVAGIHNAITLAQTPDARRHGTPSAVPTILEIGSAANSVTADGE
jgi:osmotically-inducible protein OsmY